MGSLSGCPPAGGSVSSSRTRGGNSCQPSGGSKACRCRLWPGMGRPQSCFPWGAPAGPSFPLQSLPANGEAGERQAQDWPALGSRLRQQQPHARGGAAAGGQGPGDAQSRRTSASPRCALFASLLVEKNRGRISGQQALHVGHRSQARVAGSRLPGTEQEIRGEGRPVRVPPISCLGANGGRGPVAGVPLCPPPRL